METNVKGILDDSKISWDSDVESYGSEDENYVWRNPDEDALADLIAHYKGFEHDALFEKHKPKLDYRCSRGH